MYPQFKNQAFGEGLSFASKEFDEQIEESKVHAEEFKRVLALAEKRFAALAKVEELHAKAYQQVLEKL
jgi:rubrerythrin